MTIPIWQRLLGVFIYMMPWSDSLGFGQYLLISFPLLKWFYIPALPMILIQQIIPFGSLIIFLILFRFADYISEPLILILFFC